MSSQLSANGRPIDDMSCILDFGFQGSLYLGNYESAINVKQLEKYKINSILSVCMTKIPFTVSSQMKNYQHIFIEDSENENIYKYFSSSFDFIEKGRQSGNVLVHCAAGISRSAILVAAYLMKKHNIGYKEALKQLERKRWQVYPNDGFVKQLIAYDNELNNIKGDRKINWIDKFYNINSSDSPQRQYNIEQKNQNEYQKIRRKYLDSSKELSLKKQSVDYSLQMQRKTQFEILNKGIDLQIQRQKLLSDTYQKKEMAYLIDTKKNIIEENQLKKQSVMNAINKISTSTPKASFQITDLNKQDIKSFIGSTRNQSTMLENSKQAKLDILLNQFGLQKNQGQNFRIQY